MRSISTFAKFSFIVMVALVLAVGVLSKSAVEAAQATPAATTDTSSAATAAAGGGGAAMTYPACPPATVSATESAAAPAAATAAATSAATANANPAYLGVTAEQVDSCGVRVVEVKAGSPASQAQLQPDDVIVALDGQASPDINGLRDQIRAHVPGDKITLTVERGAQQMDVVVTLSAVPADTTSTVSTPAATMAATQ